MEEEWRVIPDFPDYEVSNVGNVRRSKNNHLFSPSLDSYGYRQVIIRRDKQPYCRKVYRLVLEAFSPNIDSKPQIDHINRIRTDDRLENLRWVTSSENCRNRGGFTEDMLGISWSKKNSRYVVRLAIDKVETYFGSCETIEEAKELRDKALVGEVTFTPNVERESYGISWITARNFYQVRTNGKTVGYRKTFEEAKVLRDNSIDKHSDEDN
jgi:hypothetical protein